MKADRKNALFDPNQIAIATDHGGGKRQIVIVQHGCRLGGPPLPSTTTNSKISASNLGGNSLGTCYVPLSSAQSVSLRTNKLAPHNGSRMSTALACLSTAFGTPHA